MSTEYRLRPSSDYTGMYWLQCRRWVMCIPLWWVDIDFSNESGCWRALDSIRIRDKEPKAKCIYEKDRK